MNGEERQTSGVRRLLWVGGLAVGVLLALAFVNRAGSTCPESGNLVFLDDSCTPRR